MACRVVTLPSATVSHSRSRYPAADSFLLYNFTISILHSSTTLPFLMVFEGDTLLYYMKYSEEIREGFDEEKLVEFLEEINKGRAQAYGGDSWFQRFRRVSL